MTGRGLNDANRVRFPVSFGPSYDILRTQRGHRGLRRETKSMPPKKPPAPSVKTRLRQTDDLVAVAA